MVGARRSRLTPTASCFCQFVLQDLGYFTQQFDWIKRATDEASSAVEPFEETKHGSVWILVGSGEQRQVRDGISALEISKHCTCGASEPLWKINPYLRHRS
jgi:hypothetical protein